MSPLLHDAAGPRAALHVDAQEDRQAVLGAEGARWRVRYQCPNHAPDEYGECCDLTKAAYAQGRADERAAIVAWLRKLDGFGWIPERLVIRIERGEHER